MCLWKVLDQICWVRPLVRTIRHTLRDDNEKGRQFLLQPRPDTRIPNPLLSSEEGL
jgi:beta-lactamase regulating signal transducer with metallopeptidase domain